MREEEVAAATMAAAAAVAAARRRLGGFNNCQQYIHTIVGGIHGGKWRDFPCVNHIRQQDFSRSSAHFSKARNNVI